MNFEIHLDKRLLKYIKLNSHKSIKLIERDEDVDLLADVFER